MLPTTFLYVSGILREHRSPGVLYRDDYLHPAAATMPLMTPAEEEAYRELRIGAQPDAVVIERRHLIVNEAIPVLAARRAFCGSIDVYLANHFGGVPWGLSLETENLPGIVNVRRFWSQTAKTGFVVPFRAVLDPPDSPAYRALREEFLVRRGIQLTLFRDSGVLSEAQRAYLDNFGAPLYLVVHRWEESDAVWERFGQDPRWDRWFLNDEVKIYRWKGSDG
jgi:hypothetical protein